MTAQGTGTRILIIEDEGLVAQTLVDLVTDAGFLALGPVATAAEAVGVLELVAPARCNSRFRAERRNGDARRH